MQDIINMTDEYAEDSLELLEDEIKECLKVKPGQRGMTKEQATQLQQAWNTVKDICKVKRMIHDHHKTPYASSSHQSSARFLTQNPMHIPHHNRSEHNPMSHHSDSNSMNSQYHQGNPY